MALTYDDFEYFKQFGNSLPLMEGREKGNLAEHLETELHISDFGFLSNDSGEYAAFIVDEEPGLFFFGNSIITEMLQKVQEDGKADALHEMGIRFVMRKSAKGRTYTAFEFVF